MGECFFWYRPTWVVPDKRPLNGCVCVCVCACACVCCMAAAAGVFQLRPPQPAVYLFLLDVSFNAIETGLLFSISSCLFSGVSNYSVIVMLVKLQLSTILLLLHKNNSESTM